MVNVIKIICKTRAGEVVVECFPIYKNTYKWRKIAEKLEINNKIREENPQNSLCSFFFFCFSREGIRPIFYMC